MSTSFTSTQNSRADYRVYNFRASDLKNFLSLIAEEFKKRNMELIPDGLILKQPKNNTTGYGNTSIDVIGIPFKRVFGRTTLNYYRIKLSEFERKYAIQLGNRNAPIRIKRPPDNEQFRLRVLSTLSARTNIPESLIVLTIEDVDATPSRFGFKFKIPVTEFTTEDEGLCLVNDKVVDIYVADPAVKILSNTAIIKEDDTIHISGYTNSSSAFLSTVGFSDIYSTDPSYPEEYKIKKLSVKDSPGAALINKVYIGTSMVSVSFDTTSFLRDASESMYIAKNIKSKSDSKIILTDAKSVYVKFTVPLTDDKYYIVSTTSGGIRYIEEIPINVDSNNNKLIAIEPVNAYGYISSASSAIIKRQKPGIKSIKNIDAIQSEGYMSSSSHILGIHRQKLSIKQIRDKELIGNNEYRSSSSSLVRR